MSNKDFFKKMVAVANPDAKVTFDPKKAAAAARKVPVRQMDDDRERLKFEMINQAYGVIVEDAQQYEPPPVRSAAATDKGFFKKMVYTANPEEAKKILEAKGQASTAITEAVQAAPRPTAPLPLDEVKTVLRSYAEGLKSGIGGAYVFQTHPTLYGWTVTLSHHLEESVSGPVLEVKAQLNPDQMASRIEVALAVEEGKATKLTVGREYQSVKDMLEDFGDLAELVMKL